MTDDVLTEAQLNYIIECIKKHMPSRVTVDSTFFSSKQQMNEFLGWWKNHIEDRFGTKIVVLDMAYIKECQERIKESIQDTIDSI